MWLKASNSTLVNFYMLVRGRMGGSSAPSMNFRIANIVITHRFLANMRAAKMIASLAIRVHSIALLTELMQINIGTVRKKSSKKVWMRYRFSISISLNFIEERPNLMEKRWWMLSTPDRSLL